MNTNELNLLMLWKRKKEINPRTNRKIKVGKSIYLKYSNLYKKNFPNNYDFLDSLDNRDPISLNIFWIKNNNKKKFIYRNDISNLILYKDLENRIRCIEKNTLLYLKYYKHNKHPVTFDIIPDSVFNLINNLKLEEKNETLEEMSLRIFQKFVDLSIYIDHKKFINLKMKDLSRLYYEMKDFYYQNLSVENRINIDNNNGNELFKLTQNEYDNLGIFEAKKIILDNIDKLLNCKDVNLKYMINYIIIGSLGFVIKEVKDNYPDFQFSF